MPASKRALFLCHGRTHARHARLCDVGLPPSTWERGVYVDRNKYALPDIVGCIARLPLSTFKPGQFDVIVALHCPATVMGDSPAKVLKAIGRWLAPGGMFVTTSAWAASDPRAQHAAQGLHAVLTSLKGGDRNEYAKHAHRIRHGDDKDLKRVLEAVEAGRPLVEERATFAAVVEKHAGLALVQQRDGCVAFAKAR